MRLAVYLPNINRNIDAYLPELMGNTLIIVHDFYKVESKYNQVSWSVFRISYSNFDIDNLIVVGMNKIRTSEARFDLVFSYIYRMNSYVFKAVFDDKPFNGEPWRIWYHFGFLFGKWLDVDYSMPIETEWKKWFYLDSNYCRLQPEVMRPFIKSVVTELPPLTTEFEMYNDDDFDEFYTNTKKIVFEQYNTPKLLIANLLKLCNKHLSLDVGYDSYLSNSKFIIPDVGVYRFMAEENRRRMEIYNCFTTKSIK